MHFGSRTTSRIEGAHCFLKGYIKNSTSDLFDVFEKALLAVEHQIIENDTKMSIQRNHALYLKYNDKKVFEKVIGNVSEFALRLALDRSGKLENDCTGCFTRVFGIPCMRYIQLQ